MGPLGLVLDLGHNLSGDPRAADAMLSLLQQRNGTPPRLDKTGRRLEITKGPPQTPVAASRSAGHAER